jgi:WhiB family redox-sensing transcriptional regulator
MALVQPSWADDASCRGPERVLFFSPELYERKEHRLRRERQAKRLCGQCPVREECLETALAMNESYGIWGGLTEQERRLLRRR